MGAALRGITENFLLAGNSASKSGRLMSDAQMIAVEALGPLTIMILFFFIFGHWFNKNQRGFIIIIGFLFSVGAHTATLVGFTSSTLPPSFSKAKMAQAALVAGVITPVIYYSLLALVIVLWRKLTVSSQVPPTQPIPSIETPTVSPQIPPTQSAPAAQPSKLSTSLWTPVVIVALIGAVIQAIATIIAALIARSK